MENDDSNQAVDLMPDDKSTDRPLIRRQYWLALVFFILLSVAVTWPLARHLATRVPGWYVADNYEYLWKIWWFEHSLFESGQSPLFAPHIFYPEGFALAHAELTPLHTVLGLPVTLLFGEIPAYNLFLLLTFIVGGWFVFALVFVTTGNFWAGIFAGICFSLTPYHTVRYGGILPLAAVQGIPVFFFGLEMWARKFELRWAALTAAGFILAGWASNYYAAGLAVLAPIYCLVRFRPLRRMAADRKVWAGLLIFTALALGLMIPVALPYYRLGRQIDLVIPLDDVDFWSASLTDYILPNGIHPIWGQYVRENLLSVPSDLDQIQLEFVLGLGFVTLLFAFYGWRYGKIAAIPAVTSLTFAALVLSFGPTLHFGRHPVAIPAPAPVVSGFNRIMDSIGQALPAGEAYQTLETDGLTIPLPALLVRWLLPVFTGMRAWNRFAVFVGLGTGLLAGFGLDAYMKRELIPKGPPGRTRDRRLTLAGGVVCLLAVFELWPGGIALQQVKPRAVDEWLASTWKTPVNLMELPLGSALSAPQLLYSRYHGQNIAYAYGTYFPYWYRSQFPELRECPAEVCIRRLTNWEVDLVLLNREALGVDAELETELDRSPNFMRIGIWDEIVVYEFHP